MNDDELRNRLAAADPQACAPVDPVTSPRAQELLERIMITDTHTDAVPPTRRRGRLLVGAAAALAVAAAGSTYALTQGGGTPAPKKPTVLSLSLPAATGGVSLGSCVMITPEVLRMSPVAFAGTVTAVDAGTVTLDVTRWYAGGTADVVTLSTPAGATSSEGEITFTQGGDYLVAADRGTVGTCGLSGPASPELTSLYQKAFG